MINGGYLIPANTKKGQLIFGMFTGSDLMLFGMGAFGSLILLLTIGANETLNAVIEARNKFKTAETPEEEMAASGDLNKALGRLMVLTEAYPELKANENFIQLQTDLKDVEEKIAYARQFYNDTVLAYMNKYEMFPSNIIASMFHFKEVKYFEAGEEAKNAPKVSF